MGAGMQAINVSPERQSRRLLWVLLSFVLLVAVVIYVVARLNESNFAWGYIPEPSEEMGNRFRHVIGTLHKVAHL